MNLPKKSASAATPVAWNWTCPVRSCRAQITILNTKRGLEMQQPCPHALNVTRSGPGAIEVSYLEE